METQPMDIDDEKPSHDIRELREEALRDFCKKATKKFFEEYGPVSHQLNSYNDFIRNGLQRTFDSFGDLLVEPGYYPSKQGSSEWRYALVKFGEIILEKPSVWAGSGSCEKPMFPRHARLQHMTYSSRMKAKVSLQVYSQKMVRSDKFKTGKEEMLTKKVQDFEEREIILGRIPVMVQSDLCRMKEVGKTDCEFDPGGYFLIKGAEKVFVAQEQICMRRIWVSNNPEWAVGYKSEFKKNRVIIKLTRSSKALNNKGSKNCLTVTFLSAEIPVWILFFALGAASDREIYDMIDYKKDNPKVVNILFSTICDADKNCEGFRRNMEALLFVSKQIQETKFPPSESLEDCFKRFLFPSLDTPKQKAQFLAHMVKCLLLAVNGERKCDNRDHFRNKRLELAGELLEREMKVHISHARTRMMRALQRVLNGDDAVTSIEHYFDASIITNGISRAFSTGSWSHAYRRNVRTSGVVGNLGRTNPLQSVVDSRKTRQQVAYAGKITDARYPHPSHWGRVCFLSTPDGENCGLVKNLAITSVVSTNIQESVVDRMEECGMEKMTDDAFTKLHKMEKVFLNGEWVGLCENTDSFVADLRRMRRRNLLHSLVEIKCDKQQREVRVFSDAGRILRPLIVVENFRIPEGNFTFQNLLEKGIVELVGTEEEEDCCTAWRVGDLLHQQPLKYSHCELDMSFLLGISCGIIPFANHNHGKRVLYQAQKHSQQAIGFSPTNFNLRADTITHRLYYPQRPLFSTVASDSLGEPTYPRHQSGGSFSKPEFFNGQVAIVAVNVHLGYNQEDSIVMNRASLERGMFRTEHIRCYRSEIDNQELSDKRRRYDGSLTFGKFPSKFGRVDCLDEDGFPYIGANLQSGDIIVGRQADTGADHSMKLKHAEKGVVQRVLLSSNDEGKNFAVVSLRQVRSPCLGDKFSSMHGQKGVIGFLESQENFPFTAQGIVPDIVINPHAFPSRQTPGQLLESALGKVIACGGGLRHATPFSSPSVEAITDSLHRAGFSRWGSERVCNGRTGEALKSMIFVGPTFYQRLTHMAEDKLKFRHTGPVHPVTRQPVSDRKRFGGLKFGEMERDCLIAHGASANLHERLFTLSDSSQMHICTKCKNMANVIQRALPGGRKIRGPYCRVCESADDVVRVAVPYGAKLLYMELFSMGILLKFDTRLC